MIISDAKFCGIIKRFHRTHRYPPSIRDLVGLTPYSSTSSVDYRVRKLVAKGKLIRRAKVARSIRVVEVHHKVKKIGKSQSLSQRKDP